MADSAVDFSWSNFNLAALDQQMTLAERSVSHLDKLLAESMLREIEATVAALQPLCADPATHWPEIAIQCSKLRGFAFNAYRICSYYSSKELVRTGAPRKSPAAAARIEDLL